MGEDPSARGVGEDPSRVGEDLCKVGGHQWVGEDPCRVEETCGVGEDPSGWGRKPGGTVKVTGEFGRRRHTRGLVGLRDMDIHLDLRSRETEVGDDPSRDSRGAS